MKRVFVCLIVSVFYSTVALCDCVSTGTVYTSCKPGYYLSNGDCIRCPKTSDGVYGTTVDKNTGGKTSCYIASGVEMTDTTGTSVFTSKCYYVN